MIFGEGLETSGKPVVDTTTQEPVDLRTKTPEAGAGENAADEAAAAQAAEEKETRKQEFLATGKTEEEFEAEEARLEAEKNKTPEQIAEEKRIAEEATTKENERLAEEARIKEEIRAEFLKEMGLTDMEELKAKLNPTKPKTPEQIAEEAQIYNVNLAKYAVENKVFTNEEWLAVNNMRKAPDNELVFHNFADEYKEQNKDRKIDGNPDPVTDEEIRDKFNELYHIDSENKALKDQGEKNIALKAKAIRDPLESKFEDIKTVYDDEIAQKAAVPDFRNFVQKILAAIPDKWEYGTGDDKVVLDLTKIDKQELEQSLFTTGVAQREFQDFLKGKGSPEQKARIEREITKELLYRTHTDIAKENFKAGLSKGTKTAAPGANARFQEPDKRTTQVASVKVTAEDNAKVAKAFA